MSVERRESVGDRRKSAARRVHVYATEYLDHHYVLNLD
jgi:hypothetical protein